MCISSSMSEAKGRLLFLDGWRGLALCLMLLYHLLFDFYMFGWMSWEQLSSPLLTLLERFIAFSFILCAGISATLSRSNVKRGIVTLAAGAVVTAVSFAVGAPIRFGVLQFLGMAMLIYAAFGRWVRRVPERIAPILWTALFVIFWFVTERVYVPVRWLFWLGFRDPAYISYDHFPILPYIFLFFLGSWLGEQIRKHRERFAKLDGYAPAWLAWVGRRTLIVYLIHQPVLFGLCLLVYRVA